MCLESFMKSTRARLDRFIRQKMQKNAHDIRRLLSSGRIWVDGEPAHGMSQVITQFSLVSVDGLVIQDDSAVYVMANKPKGVVCATKDDHHTTIIDVLDEKRKSQLHIVGRLDFNTSGLVLLTNDGRWSRCLSSPEAGVEKWYAVTLEKPLTQAYVNAFERGMYFSYENITTRPAVLHITGDFTANLMLREGRYHQVKRMFGAFQNKVLELHRFAVGNLYLNESLRPGENRRLSETEASRIFDVSV